MNTRRLPSIADLDVLQTAHCPEQSGASTSFESFNAEAVVAARARISTAARESRRRNLSANGVYYGTKTRAQLEETIDELASATIDAVVTRNHYGCLVLNAARTLFIDVDFVPASPECGGSAEHRQATWETMLADLSLVLADERDLGFRVYRTKAGFRLLATNREFEPHSPRVKQLMNAVSADEDFVQLCRLQRNFRARLTPKPWRCGAKRPPNFFPRESADDQQAFSEWLTGYEDACRDRATCRLLGHVGRSDTHRRIAPIIELHDRQTRALESLPLA
jgi:hypothetical protein